MNLTHNSDHRKPSEEGLPAGGVPGRPAGHESGDPRHYASAAGVTNAIAALLFGIAAVLSAAAQLYGAIRP
jgi:hypothetical protein